MRCKRLKSKYVRLTWEKSVAKDFDLLFDTILFAHDDGFNAINCHTTTNCALLYATTYLNLYFSWIEYSSIHDFLANKVLKIALKALDVNFRL